MDKTLLKGLVVLEALARSEHPRGVTELAADLGMMKSTVHRVLRTLKHAGFAQQDAHSGRYECTLKSWELGSQVVGRLDVRRAARPHMERLAESTLETVHLAILDRVDVLYLDKVDSRMPIRLHLQAGGRAPAYCVSTGKVLLAFRDRAEIDERTPELTAHTERTIVDRAALGRELDRIRRAGYVIQRGEWRAEVAGLAAPIFDANADAVAAIAVSGPASRLTASRLQGLVSVVVDAAQHISRDLGYRREGGANPS